MTTMRRIESDAVCADDLFEFANDAVAVGQTVIYMQRATYPVHVRGLGGRSVANARALRDDLTACIELAERPVQGCDEPPGIRLRCDEPPGIRLSCPECRHTDWVTPTRPIIHTRFTAAGSAGRWAITCPCGAVFQIEY